MRNFAHALVLDWARAEARNGIEFHLNGHLPRLDAEDIPRLMAVGHFLAKFSFPAYAEKVYFRVTDLDESHLEAWLGRARAASTPQEAVKCFERALQLNPEDAQTRLELQAAEERLRTDAIGLVEDAQALTRKGAREQARALLEQVTQMDPKNERAWVGLARTTDDLDTALEFVKRALEIDPQNAEALELHSWLWRPINEPREPGRARRLLLSIGLAALVILVALALLGLAFMR